LARVAGDQRQKRRSQPEFFQCTQAKVDHRGVDLMSTRSRGKFVCEKLIGKITWGGADSYVRDPCPQRSVLECMMADTAAPSRERGHLARFGACGGDSAPQGRVALPRFAPA
jgi:hypothetical protein